MEKVAIGGFSPAKPKNAAFAQAFEPNPNIEVGPQARAYQSVFPAVLYFPSIF